MEKTWRWFGKKDKITLQMLRQIGVEGIVTALHDVKNGEIWTIEAITDLKNYIEAAGLRWSVVESLPDVQQTILRLRHMEGMEMKDIARLLQMEETAVRKALSRARQAVRERLKIENRR